MAFIKLIICFIVACFLFGCIGSYNSNDNLNTKNSTGVNMSNNTIIVFETTKGNFTVELYESEAPATTANFITLVKSGFYDGLTFHRYEPGFVIQGGDPKGDGTGGSSKTIKLEINSALKHDVGTLSMARTDNPNSASSQFFIVIGEAHFLDGQYAVFGKVSDGLDVVMKLRKGDKMNKVYQGDR
jgi:cyclophilin family peptidyl-prolyl cis-trans isomerase